jgi:GNAT superfamily N-acetyltransferase
MARWHACSVEALGHASIWAPGMWATNGAIPELYLNAIVFGVGARQDLETFVSDCPPQRGLVIADGTNELDLAPLGLAREPGRPSFWRPPGQVGAPRIPDELEIVEVKSANQLADFEATAARGFERQTPLPRFAWHAPDVLTEPRFRMWLGRVDDRGIGAAMAYTDDDLIGIYGVAVVPAARRRGYGAALTWQAIQTKPELPAALQPSDIASAMYQRLGFQPIGHFSAWRRGADT